MMTSIAPFWDGNETWLVVIGASLFAAFPGGLRGVSRRFLPAGPADACRADLPRHRVRVPLPQRRHAPVLGRRILLTARMLVAFVQGAAVGAMMRGIPVEDMQYAGGAFIWLHPFPVLTGIGLMLGYALLGACWIVLQDGGRAAGLGLCAHPLARRRGVRGTRPRLHHRADHRFRRHCPEQSWAAQLGAGLADVQPCRASGPSGRCADTARRCSVGDGSGVLSARHS